MKAALVQLILTLLLLAQALAGTMGLTYGLLFGLPAPADAVRAPVFGEGARSLLLEGAWAYRLDLPPYEAEGVMMCAGQSCQGESAAMVCEPRRQSLLCEAVFGGATYFSGELIFLTPETLVAKSGYGFAAWRTP